MDRIKYGGLIKEANEYKQVYYTSKKGQDYDNLKKQLLALRNFRQENGLDTRDVEAMLYDLDVKKTQKVRNLLNNLYQSNVNNYINTPISESMHPADRAARRQRMQNYFKSNRNTLLPSMLSGVTPESVISNDKVQDTFEELNKLNPEHTPKYFADPANRRKYMESQPVYNKLIKSRTGQIMNKDRIVPIKKQDRIDNFAVLDALGMVDHDKLRSSQGHRGLRLYTDPDGNQRLVDPKVMPADYITQEKSKEMLPQQSTAPIVDVPEDITKGTQFSKEYGPKLRKKLLTDKGYYDQKKPGLAITNTQKDRDEFANKGFSKYINSDRMITASTRANINRRKHRFQKGYQSIYEKRIAPEEFNRRQSKAKYIKQNLPKTLPVRDVNDTSRATKQMDYLGEEFDYQDAADTLFDKNNPAGNKLRSMGEKFVNNNPIGKQLKEWSKPFTG